MAAGPADAKNKKKKGEDNRPRIIVCLARCGVCLRKAWATCGRPSIHTFFLWSCLFFIACGASTAVFAQKAQKLFCAVRPQIEFGGQGCDQASSKLLLCSKGTCWRNAANITYMTKAVDPTKPLYQSFEGASTDSMCNKVVKAPGVIDPVGMIVELASQIVKTRTMLNVTWDAEACKDYHCNVLLLTLQDGDLSPVNGNTCTNLHRSKPRAETSACVCASTWTDTSFQHNELPDVNSVPVSAAMTAIKSTCGKFIMKAMVDLCTKATPPVWCVPAPVADKATSAVSTTIPAASPGGSRRLGPLGNNPGERRRAMAGATNNTPKRRLVEDKDYDDFNAGRWTPCTCYQQCTPGIRTRSVSCDATRCREPRPAAQQHCVCEHAAKCVLGERLLSLFVVFFVQAFLAFIVFVCYLRTLNQTEDDFIKMGCCRQFGGIFYKQVPPLLRLLVFTQLFQLVWLIIDVWLMKVGKDHTGGHQKDCFASKDLRLCTVICAVLWLVQVFMGNCTKQYTRKPDWLYAPDQAYPFPLRQLRKCFRCIGP